MPLVSSRIGTTSLGITARLLATVGIVEMVGQVLVDERAPFVFRDRKVDNTTCEPFTYSGPHPRRAGSSYSGKMNADEPTPDAKSDAIIQIGLEEFRAIRAEINQRLTAQITIATIAPLLVGIAVATSSNGDRVTVILVASLISLLFAFLYLSQDITIAMAGQYIQSDLRKHLLKAVYGDENKTTGELNWEKFRIDNLYAEGRGKFLIRAVSAIGSVVLATPAVVSLAFITVALFFDDFRTEVQLVSYVLIGIGWVLLGMLIWISRELIKRYRDIGTGRR